MIEHFGSNQRMSNIVTHNGCVYLSGQVARTDTAQDIAGKQNKFLIK